MTVETKKIDKKVLMKEYSRVFAFNFDEKRIDLYLALSLIHISEPTRPY